MTSIKNVEFQFSQMANDLGDWKAKQLEELPSQFETNPKENASEVALESEKQFQEPPQRAPKTKVEQNELCNNVMKLKKYKIMSEGSRFYK